MMHHDIAHWIHLVQAEYLESPGLQLTKTEVQRLWSLDSLMCEAVLDALEHAKFLKRTSAGRYARVDAGP